MTQPKRKKDEQAELVKLFRSIIPGDFIKVLENSIQSISSHPNLQIDITCHRGLKGL